MVLMSSFLCGKQNGINIGGRTEKPLETGINDGVDWWPGLWKSAAKWLHATKPGEVRRAGSNPVQSIWFHSV